MECKTARLGEAISCPTYRGSDLACTAQEEPAECLPVLPAWCTPPRPDLGTIRDHEHCHYHNAYRGSIRQCRHDRAEKHHPTQGLHTDQYGSEELPCAPLNVIV